VPKNSSDVAIVKREKKHLKLLSLQKPQKIQIGNPRRKKSKKKNTQNKIAIPSPQGVLLVVMRRTLVGSLTGPQTVTFFSLAPFTKSEQTNQKEKANHGVPNNWKESFVLWEIIWH